MSDVMIVFLEGTKDLNGEKDHQAGEAIAVNQRLAEQYVRLGKACFYSEFSSDMLRADRQSRVLAAPQNAAVAVEAPEAVESEAPAKKKKKGEE